MALKKRVNRQQYKSIKRYLIGSIATTVALVGITLGAYISTNQRIDKIYDKFLEYDKKFEQQMEVNYQILGQIREHDYKISDLEKMVYPKR